MTIDRAALADFLRSRREALRPEDVGLRPGERRRTAGLRREEVALLSNMSTDYYSRLEQQRGPHPSEQMIASIAQGLHLTHVERDHLFRVAGLTPPLPGASLEHIAPGMLRIFDRLADTAAEIVTETGESLRQSPLAVALLGDLTRLRGPERSLGFRWFTDAGTRARYHPDDHDHLTRMFASGLRELTGLRGPASRPAELARILLDRSAEFRATWELHEVGIRPRETKRFLHPELGDLELSCQTLVDPATAQLLLVYTAAPGSESYEKLQLLSVIGAPA